LGLIFNIEDRNNYIHTAATLLNEVTLRDFSHLPLFNMSVFNGPNHINDVLIEQKEELSLASYTRAMKDYLRTFENMPKNNLKLSDEEKKLFSVRNAKVSVNYAAFFSQPVNQAHEESKEDSNNFQSTPPGGAPIGTIV